MTPKLILTVMDCLFKDIATLPADKQKFMGGKVLLLCGDFRQTLPVVPHAGRVQAIEACLKRHPIWQNVKCFPLRQNMRVNHDEQEFASYLLKVGNGELPIGQIAGIFIVNSHLVGCGESDNFFFDSRRNACK